MKSPITRIATILLPAVLLLAGTAHGQSAQHTMKVTVPFEFIVGDKVFPAGEYSIVRTAPDLLDVRDSRDHVLALLVTHCALSPNDKPGSPRLTFLTVAGQHVLTQVWMESSRIGYELPLPKPDFVVAKHRSPAPTQTTSSGAGYK
jgi:hypothetical protein